jgi:hypothetical protein
MKFIIFRFYGKTYKYPLFRMCMLKETRLQINSLSNYFIVNLVESKRKIIVRKITFRKKR